MGKSRDYKEKVDDMNDLVKSILKTAVYFLDQTNAFTSNVKDRVSDSIDEASDRVSDLRDRASHLRDRASDFYGHEDHTLRNVLTFAAGVGVGIGAAMLFAPASGEEFREQIGEKVQDIGDRVRSKFSDVRNATGTEGN
jgi:gas vesicle protein